MARVSIYVSDDLKGRMDAAGDAINWSEVARPAFLSALTTHEHRMAKTMTSAIERLRSSKAKWLTEAETCGKTEGREWAENRAEYGDLVAFSAIELSELNADDEKEMRAAFDHAVDPEENRQDWVWTNFSFETGQQIYAFIEGVQEFFAEVKGQL